VGCQGAVSAASVEGSTIVLTRLRATGDDVMTAQQTTTTTTTTTTITTTTATHSDPECWAIACDFLVDLLGELPADLAWDDRHHLQGHAHIGGHEVVVIAPRDDRHRPILVTVQDWDEIRAADCGRRDAVLADAAITNRSRLASVLSLAA
jgi:hypothetical protein